MRTYSTSEVARMLQVNRVTLQRWLIAGKVPGPRRISNAGIDARIWTARDVERVRAYKAAFYRKGRGRRKKSGGPKMTQRIALPMLVELSPSEVDFRSIKANAGFVPTLIEKLGVKTANPEAIKVLKQRLSLLRRETANTEKVISYLKRLGRSLGEKR